ncbi:ras association domain-containing protein 1-like isoform X2 [Mya arenaria]|uniref:ras association domain-containing protein 1-like isoform X2 n=1 Tax=Mya arenaria TaxID=6604 RepID=UPI0022E2FB1C|nr:ras association domain-containing protein 1-like isoform X2 [Mya arenaria]XP_052780031.1 ras association domain-containing protein 1-like isoform X2 [Mya arenaria]XP_052780032.1 ras association domain-containing protein 1-like isoform X2 [Mya arenaria]
MDRPKANQHSSPLPSSRSEGDFFDAIRNGLKNYRNVFGLFPFMGRATEEPSPSREQIEMAHFEKEDDDDDDDYEKYEHGTILRRPAKGHDFQVHQLTHPTWCDECGDFIWGAYKQCLKCNNCQYTCHHQCLPSIQLECKCMSHDQEDEGTVLSGETTLADLAASSQSAEQSEPASEKDETDSGYRSGTIPDEKLPPKPSDATLNREELKKRISEFNKLVQGANFALLDPDRAFNDEEASDCQTEPFQGFIKVVLNLVRPISMSLGARPPSIYEVLTQEHIVEHNTQNISFYMPRDTVRSIHAHSTQSTKEVISLLLKKFHILDHPRKFALYEQELKNNKIARIRRVKDIESPLAICLSWEFENIHNHRLVLQENETGEIDWEAFCVPELNNFLRVLDREQDEYMAQLRYKYKVMKRLILQRMKELRLETERQKRASVVGDESTS